MHDQLIWTKKQWHCKRLLRHCYVQASISTILWELMTNRHILPSIIDILDMVGSLKVILFDQHNVTKLVTHTLNMSSWYQW